MNKRANYESIIESGGESVLRATFTSFEDDLRLFHGNLSVMCDGDRVASLEDGSYERILKNFLQSVVDSVASDSVEKIYEAYGIETEPEDCKIAIRGKLARSLERCDQIAQRLRVGLDPWWPDFEDTELENIVENALDHAHSWLTSEFRNTRLDGRVKFVDEFIRRKNRESIRPHGKEIAAAIREEYPGSNADPNYVTSEIVSILRKLRALKSRPHKGYWYPEELKESGFSGAS